MVESTALEMRRALTGTVGSNPTLSAKIFEPKPGPGRVHAGPSAQPRGELAKGLVVERVKGIEPSS